MITSRRIVLRGFGGAIVGLPLLEATHGRAWAQGAAGPKRFTVFFEHGGTLSASQKSGKKYDGNGGNNGVDAWMPKSAPGAPLELGAIHQPLTPYADQLVVVTGVDNMAAKKQSPYSGDHGWNNATALTAANVTFTAGGTGNSGDDKYTTDRASIDTVLAQRLAQRSPSRFGQIHLTIPAHNYGTPFYSGPSQKDSGEWNPLAAFDKLFAGVTVGNSAPDPVATRALALRKSVLDGVTDGLTLYQKRLSASDRQTVQAHLDHIRGIEKQLTTGPVSASCTKPAVAWTAAKKPDVYDSETMVQASPMMVDILVAALRCGLTNVAAFEIGGYYVKFLNPTWPAGYNIDHSLHHDARYAGKTGSVGAQHFKEWYDTMIGQRQFKMKLVARFLEGLKSTPEAGGTMLDNSLMLYTSEFSCGADHSAADVPLLLAGKAGGRLRTGRYVNYNVKAQANPATLDYQTSASTHNLFTSILNMFGFPDTQFGSNHAYVPGPLPDLA